ncbi:MAG: DUF255 domain-containing protein [Planctomycetes bacterium]|nr:DUF255 domain-containing protein [Planctomycetota bacterium]
MSNRLARESSPYLLQHAHNPVDWWPWCDEAFEEARRRDVPVFLSIGYSTCYWCHVMERESFEREELASAINPRFVCIKVDREERPDVDEAYMAATVMMSGQGGWPMSVFIEPTKRRPFYCGTYFPFEERAQFGRPSFPRLLDAMATAWRDSREEVMKQAAAVAEAVQEHFAAEKEASQLGQEQVADAVSQLLRMLDVTHGGFGQAPKFPQPVFLEFLLDARERAADDSTGDALDRAIRRSLDGMMAGGINDQIGGGFHRYSVDAEWTVPHFEKMLYDNAQLATIYARAARFYGDDEYRRTARATLAFVLREMTDPASGAFYSALDAEVDGREGLNYLWTPPEMRAALAEPDDAHLATRAYGLDKGPNFRDPHHPTAPGTNVPRLADRADRLASQLGLLPGMLIDRLTRINAQLLAARDKRKQPRRDDKVIAAWNGLMIGAFARTGELLEEPEYIHHAQRAADSVRSKLVDPDGRLSRCVRQENASGRAVLEDYACLAQGLLHLHRAKEAAGLDTADNLAAAGSLLAVAQRDFVDGGVAFDSPRNADDLFVRTRSLHDGAIPSGSSVFLNALLDHAELAQNTESAEMALKLLVGASGSIAQAPVGTVNSTRALLRILLAGEGREELGAAPSKPTRPQGPRPAQEVDPVQIFAGVERVSISRDSPATVTLLINIAEGWHIAAAAPGDGVKLVPFRVEMRGGTGIAAYADYPPGDKFSTPGQAEILVYRGTIELHVALEQTGEVTGRPLLNVVYQACSETECLAPALVELDIAIDEI